MVFLFYIDVEGLVFMRKRDDQVRHCGLHMINLKKNHFTSVWLELCKWW